MNTDEIYIVKNDGSKELFDASKIHNHLKYACDGLDVDIISIIKDARLKLVNGSRSVDIQESLIKSAAEKISENSPDYELAAGRLLNQKLRKMVYGQHTPLSFKECVKERIKKGIYTEDLNAYSDEELDYFGSLIDYDLDDKLIYSSMMQFTTKYLIKIDGKIVETPQELFMLVPMAIFYNEPVEYRKKYVKIGYELLSQRKISLPTPIMNGARTNFKRFISCNLINFGDSVKSLSEGIAAVMKCTASKSGLGGNVSFVRGLGASVGKPSRLEHTGILPIIKTIEAATGSLSQIGRGGCHFKDTEVYVVESVIFNNQTYLPNEFEIDDILKKYADKHLKINYKKILIQNIKVGDYVQSYNIKTNTMEPRKVTQTFRPEVINPCKLTFEDSGYVINSYNHPFLVFRDGKWDYATTDKLKIDDIVLNNYNNTVKIKKIEKLCNDEYPKDDFYDLEVEYNHNFFAGFNGTYCGHNSINLNMPFFHYEIELFSQLGDARGSLENRARHTDQTIILNKWFIEKALNKDDIYLFHMNEVSDNKYNLYDSLGDYDQFNEAYEHFVKKVGSKHKKKINAWDLLNLFILERSMTGRVYFVFADNFKASSYIENLYMTNLCCLSGDTLVVTPNGKCELKNIKSGDYVLSHNINTGENEYKKVLNSIMTHPSKEVYDIEYNGKVITCTGDHRFLTERGYIRADELLESDKLVELV